MITLYGDRKRIQARAVERIVLDLESEAMRGPGSIPTTGFFLFSRSKDKNATTGIFV